MSSRLSLSAVVTPASFSEVVPSASRFSETKPCTCTTASLRSRIALATSSGPSVSSPVTEARFWFRRRIRSVLS